MCQRLYIASRKELKTQRLGKRSPFLSVREVSDDTQARGRFSPERPFVYLAGGQVVCGCGFPAIQAEEDAEPDQMDPADLERMRAWADHLREACRRHSSVELYLCWVHEESEPALGRRTVSIDDLRSPSFRLRHRELNSREFLPTGQARQRLRQRCRPLGGVPIFV
jgi:hypothetical protein